MIEHPKGQYFYSHGKLLLTGEYFLLDGALGLAMPTMKGQSLSIKYAQTFDTPVVEWKSYGPGQECWFEAKFETWHFKLLEFTPGCEKKAKLLQHIFQMARELNHHFLRDPHLNVLAQTRLEFPSSPKILRCHRSR